MCVFFCQAEDGIRDLVRSRGLRDLYKRQAWDLPSTFLVVMSERARCLPHKKHDMVAPPKDAAAMNGEPDTLDL